MGEASFSSGKASLDQAERTGQTLQNNHIESVSRPIDQAILFDAITDGKLTVPDASPLVVMAGEYSRPPKFSMDRKKDAETVQAYIDAGFSETFAFASIGQNWEDHQEQKKEEAAFRKAQGIEVVETVQPTETDRQTEKPAQKKPGLMGKIFGKKKVAA
jgi:capsid protein